MHCARIDHMFTCLDRALFFIGGLATIASVGVLLLVSPAKIPLLLVCAVAGYIGAFLERFLGLGENTAKFIFWIKDSLFFYLSEFLRILNAPAGLVQWLWSQSKSILLVNVGLCMECKTAPRSVISANCLHMAFCNACSLNASHCPCGAIFYNTNPTITIDVRPCQGNCCMEIPSCDCCEMPSTGIFYTEKFTRYFRCKKHYDKTAKRFFPITWGTSTCKPPEAANLELPTPE